MVDDLRHFADIKQKLEYKEQWTPTQDDILIKALASGINKWPSIADLLPGKSAGECRHRWESYLRACLQEEKWTYAEDQKLVEAYSQWGNCWTKIAKTVPGRSEKACHHRWQAVLFYDEAHVCNSRLSNNKRNTISTKSYDRNLKADDPTKNNVDDSLNHNKKNKNGSFENKRENYEIEDKKNLVERNEGKNNNQHMNKFDNEEKNINQDTNESFEKDTEKYSYQEKKEMIDLNNEFNDQNEKDSIDQNIGLIYYQNKKKSYKKKRERLHHQSQIDQKKSIDIDSESTSKKKDGYEKATDNGGASQEIKQTIRKNMESKSDYDKINMKKRKMNQASKKNGSKIRPSRSKAALAEREKEKNLERKKQALAIKELFDTQPLTERENQFIRRAYILGFIKGTGKRAKNKYLARNNTTAKKKTMNARGKQKSRCIDASFLEWNFYQPSCSDQIALELFSYFSGYHGMNGDLSLRSCFGSSFVNFSKEYHNLKL